MNNQNNQQIRYDLHRNPPYQINYRSKRAGKHITATKRRITFQFGFSSAEAIASGEIEAACRGEEHEVVLIWSHVSGKRELFMDGKLIHTSRVAYANTKFQFTWGIGPHVLKIVGNFKDQAKNNSRQFDLQLDGISFFRFLNIYQLGRMKVKRSTTSISSSSNSNSYPQAHPKYSYQGTAYKEDDMTTSSQTSRSVRVPPEVNVMPMDLLDAPSLAISMVSSGSTLGTTDEFCPTSYDSISNTILSAYNKSSSNVTQLSSQQPLSDDSNSRALVPVLANQMFGYYGCGQKTS